MTRAKNRALSSTTAGVGAISTPSSASRSAPTAARTPAALRGTCVCFPGRRDPAGTSYPSGESAPLRSSHFRIGNLTKLIFNLQVLRQLREALHALLLRRLRGQPQQVRLPRRLPAVVPFRVPAKRRLSDEAGAGAVQGLSPEVRSYMQGDHNETNDSGLY